MSKFVQFLREEDGAAAAEYALILAIVGAGIAGAALYLGNQIADSMGATGQKIKANTVTDPGSADEEWTPAAPTT